MKIINPDLLACPVFVLTQQYPSYDGVWHQHQRAQLIYASEGLLTVKTEQGLWVVPPHRAVWIVPGIRHKACAPKGFHLKTLYVTPEIAPVPTHCCAVTIDPLLDALFSEAASFGTDYPAAGPQQRLLQVIIDRLAHLQAIPAYLPAPQDARLRKLTALLEDNPADARSLTVLASTSGMSDRTAARLFIKETGITFAQWRQQLRLLCAIQLLSQGTSVGNVADQVGYQDVSSFITVFKKVFGDTPARYLNGKS
ncbi:AraC family transcriptional regulator [Ampullimonas aquatilis]|uniref:AraC family transcriptional regulator n=1 Tax=Ampullimonas aquatilis TaxID=1341549 RepID=UPI003C76EDB0